MSEELIPEQLSLDEQIDNKLVKANVTEAVIADLRERYLPLKIAGIDDKETYMLVKEGRKNCKAIRVMAKKICTDGREEAVAIQKKWVAKEKEVTSRIAEVEDYLEEQEKSYEAEVAAEKEARKRKQEEQLIMRQQVLSGMGALYSDGNFILGEVSFEFSAIKESEDDIWEESILPKFKDEWYKIQAEQLLQEQEKQKKEAELKRQQEELEAERKRLKDEAERLQAEKNRQEEETRRKKKERFDFRYEQIKALGFIQNGEVYRFREFEIIAAELWNWEDNAWQLQMASAKQYVDAVNEKEAEEKRKEQERIELQNKRYAELYPYKEYIGDNSIKMDGLWLLPEEQYMGLLDGCRSAQQKAEEEKAKKIAEEAAKAERERIEEEQRMTELKRVNDLRRDRMALLRQYNADFRLITDDLGEITEEGWAMILTDVKGIYEETIRKQEEERKAEELAQASDKVKWADIIKSLQELEIHDFRSGQYRKKAAILREKLEEIKAL